LLCYGDNSELVYSAVSDGRPNAREDFRSLTLFIVHIYDYDFSPDMFVVEKIGNHLNALTSPCA
jgi:hypothetical protein